MNAKGGPAVAYTEQRLASIASAIPLTTDKTVIEANALMATALASQIKLLPLQNQNTNDNHYQLCFLVSCHSIQER